MTIVAVSTKNIKKKKKKKWSSSTELHVWPQIFLGRHELDPKFESNRLKRKKHVKLYLVYWKVLYIEHPDYTITLRYLYIIIH